MCLVLLLFEGLLFGLFTAIMLGTQLSAICSDETVFFNYFCKSTVLPDVKTAVLQNKNINACFATNTFISTNEQNLNMLN